jgi:hypothetical protein
MAPRKKEPALELGAIEADRQYRVKFRLPHAIGRTRFSPIHSYRIKGKLLTEIPVEKLSSVEAI